MALQYTSAAVLDSMIRCSVDNGAPFDLLLLRAARDAEAASTGARIAKILNKFIVNCQVGSQYKKIADAFLQIQIRNTCTHKAGFANPCGN